MISSQSMLTLDIHRGSPTNNPQIDRVQDGPQATNEFQFLDELKDVGVYRELKPNFLEVSQVTGHQRYMLKNWLLEEMSKHFNLRETYAVGSKYLDLYLMKQKTTFSLNSFQNLGISCWILASKVCGERIPPINFENYNEQEVWGFEKQICSMLGFNLQPITYLSLADVIVTLWDRFLSHFEIYSSYNYCAKTEPGVKYYCSFLEILDGLDLIPMSYEFMIQELILNAFFLENYLNLSKKHSFASNSEIEQIMNANNEYHRLFAEFTQFLNAKCHAFRNSNLKKRAIKLVLPFLSKSDKNSPLNPIKAERLHTLRFIQTQNREICKVAKAIIRNSNR